MAFPVKKSKGKKKPNPFQKGKPVPGKMPKGKKPMSGKKPC